MFGSQFDGGSLFSGGGGGFMPSQSTQTTDSLLSSSSAKNRGAQSLLPLTVKQISDAYQSIDEQSNFVVDGVEVNNVSLLGIVMNKVERVTNVSFSLDDGTGRIDINRFVVNEGMDSNEMAVIKNGMYVRVNGHLKSFQGKKHAMAFSVRPVTDFNEIACHFNECIFVHMYNTRLQGGEPAQSQTPNRVMSTPSQNGSKGHEAISNQFTGHSSVRNESGNDLYKMVLDIFEEPASIASEHGIHLDELVERLGVPLNKIKEAVDYHADSGDIYSTIDENHYKSAREN